jgi:hypothetical protein
VSAVEAEAVLVAVGLGAVSRWDVPASSSGGGATQVMLAA